MLRVMHLFAYDYASGTPNDSPRAWTMGVACVVIVTSLFFRQQQQQNSFVAGGQSLRLSGRRRRCRGELINPFIRAGVATSDDRFANGSGRQALGGRRDGGREARQDPGDALSHLGGRDSGRHPPGCRHVDAAAQITR